MRLMNWLKWYEVMMEKEKAKSYLFLSSVLRLITKDLRPAQIESLYRVSISYTLKKLDEVQPGSSEEILKEIQNMATLKKQYMGLKEEGE